MERPALPRCPFKGINIEQHQIGRNHLHALLFVEAQYSLFFSLCFVKGSSELQAHALLSRLPL